MLIPLYVLTLIHVSLHELGHGVTCKHFGGKVPRMGIMFYLASFIFFCDTTASYTFREKRKRLLVSLGGPFVSFAIFGLGLWGQDTSRAAARYGNTYSLPSACSTFSGSS